VANDAGRDVDCAARVSALAFRHLLPTAGEQPLQILVIARGRRTANAALVLEFSVKAQPPTAHRPPEKSRECPKNRVYPQ